MKLSALSLLSLVIGVMGSAVAAADNAPPVVSPTRIGIGMPAPIIVREAPPERAVEPLSDSPGPGHSWVSGHPSWRNGAWSWQPSAWVRPPHPGLVWVDGRWDAGTNSWTGEHWAYAQTTPPPPVVLAPDPKSPVVIVSQPPPPPRIERRGQPPGRDHLWINGHWFYQSGRHVWVPGYWVVPPRGQRVWIEPRWDRRGGNWIFIQGRWR